MKYFFEKMLENLLVVIHFPVYILNIFFRLKSTNNNPTQKYPIILVERWFRHNAFHAFGKWYLEHSGFKVYTINYTLIKGSFNNAAQSLEQFIEDKKLENVVLVGISAGAITILTYLQKYNGWNKTHIFVSVGGPLHGSPKAIRFPLTKSVQELQPKSEFLKDLYAGGIKNKDKIYCITAKEDNIVPDGYSTIEGSHIVKIDVIGHNLLHTFWIPTYKKISEIAQF